MAQRLTAFIKYYRPFLIPLIFLSFLSCFVLPFASRHNANFFEERLNKYDGLLDSCVYRSEDPVSFAENLKYFEEDGLSGYSRSFYSINEIDFLCVETTCEAYRFGIPYYDTFVRFPGCELKPSFYYSNHKNVSGDISFDGELFSFGGYLDFNLPHLDVFSNVEGERNVVVFITENVSFLLSKSEVVSCYDLNSQVQSGFSFSQMEVGRKIKERYLAEHNDAVSFSKNAAVIPYVLSFLLLLFFCFLIDKRFQNETKVERLFVKNQSVLFFGFWTRWLAVIGVPSLAGYLISTLVCLTLGILEFSAFDLILMLLVVTSTLIMALKEACAHEPKW